MLCSQKMDNREGFLYITIQRGKAKYIVIYNFERVI